MGYAFNPFTGNFDQTGAAASIPDPLVVDNLTVNTLLTAAHIHGGIAGSLYVHVKNTSGGPLSKGTPVYATGAVGDTTTLEVSAADSANAAKVPAIGILDSDLAQNSFGHAVMFGEITGLNTGSYAINDELYVAAAGGLTATKPTTGYVQAIAIVGRVHSTTGTLLVKIGSQMDDAAGSDTHVQFNDAGNLGGSSDLTYNKTTKVLTNKGDVNLDDGGSFTTTLQTITPTANRTLSLPDATGTVALVAGSSGQVVWNNAGAYAGVANSTVDTSGNITIGGRLTNSVNAALSAPPVSVTGTWITTGGTATTTKPTLLVEPTGTTSTAWSTAGTGLGVNAPSGFAGNLLDLQVNGSRVAGVSATGSLFFRGASGSLGSIGTDFIHGHDNFNIRTSNGAGTIRLDNTGFGVISQTTYFDNANAILRGRDDNSGPGSLTIRAGVGGVDSSVAQSLTLIGGSAPAGGLAAGGLFLIGGSGLSTSSGAANGGNINLDGGQGYGTGTNGNIIIGATRGNLQITDARNIILGTTTGTRIGTTTTQKLSFFNATPVVQPTAVTDLTTTATAGSLPTANGTVTIADAAAPTNAELLEYCVELEAKLEAALSRLRDLGLIAT